MVAFALSVIGASHAKSGKPCQDASLCVKEKTYTFIAVADGHGGERYFRSDLGSRFACEAARECLTDKAVIRTLKKNALSEEETGRTVLQLKKSVVSRWNTLVAEHISHNPFTEEELSGESYAEACRADGHAESAYGSTLIAALWTKNFLLVLHIGDGSCVLLDTAGEFSRPVPADERCFLNTTTSLCDKDAIGEFRHYWNDSLSDSRPAAVWLVSDGIDDCFAGEEKLFGFYRVMVSSFTEKDGEAAIAELADYLPRMSEKGSGDDMSVAMIADRESLANIPS